MSLDICETVGSASTLARTQHPDPPLRRGRGDRAGRPGHGRHKDCGLVLLIPKFLVITQLGIYDSYPGLIVPLLTDAAGVFIMKQFFESIPPSIEEAAHIDGAGTFRTFWSVVLPMARPALIALTILSFQGSWNDFSDILIAHQNPSLDTLTTGVGRLVSGELGTATQYPLKLAAAVLMTIPVAVVLLVFQKKKKRTRAGAGKE